MSKVKALPLWGSYLRVLALSFQSYLQERYPQCTINTMLGTIECATPNTKMPLAEIATVVFWTHNGCADHQFMQVSFAEYVIISVAFRLPGMWDELGRLEYANPKLMKQFDALIEKGFVLARERGFYGG